MSKTQFERTPLNAEGDFYVVKDMCITCMAPHHEAPELMGMDEETGCYFRRQPQTAEELERAVEAVRVSCVEALRYSGDDRGCLSGFGQRGVNLRAMCFHRTAASNNGMHPTADTLDFKYLQSLGAGDAGR
jgi:hypothetical protein